MILVIRPPRRQGAELHHSGKKVQNRVRTNDLGSLRLMMMMTPYTPKHYCTRQITARCPSACKCPAPAFSIPYLHMMTPSCLDSQGPETEPLEDPQPFQPLPSSKSTVMPNVYTNYQIYAQNCFLPLKSFFEPTSWEALIAQAGGFCETETFPGVKINANRHPQIAHNAHILPEINPHFS